MTTPLVRFAPSPTGNLHVGNMRTALVNYLFARKAGGRFMLRIDDTDDERSTPEFEASIRHDLKWMGMDWDCEDRQSGRIDRYLAALDGLVKSGRAYKCFETQEELSLKRKSQLASGRPPVYDRTALKLNDKEIAAKEALGEKPHYRFKLEDTTVIWTDLVRGEVSVPMSSLSDPVILRADGRVIYTLASVVDDIDHGITHILRGEDHTTNSAAQIQLFEALGGTPPMMGHFALLAGVDGEGLSKRLGSLSITSLREDGIEPLAIASLLGRIGTSDPIEPRQSLAEVIAGFNVSRFGRATPRFDGAELKPMNSRILGNTPYEVMADRLILDNTPYEVMANLLNAIVILGFDISSFGRATPRFDEAELKLMNSRILDNTPYEEMADLLNALVNALVILSFDISRFGRATPGFGGAELKLMNSLILDNTPYEVMADLLNALVILGFDISSFGRATPGFGGAELKLMNSLILDNTPYEVMADLLNALVILGFDISRFGRATPGFDGAELKLMNSRILGNTPYEEMAGLLNAIVNALVILGFDISRFGRATPGFDGAELKLMDSRILGNTLYKVMADRLNALDIKSVGIEGGSASFWNAIRGNIETVAEAEDWFDIATLPISPIIEDASLLLVAQNCLPEGATTADTWGAWTKAIMAETGLKGRAVFMPLRLALTGQSAGPELQGLLPLMGRERILARLNGEKA